MKNLWKVLICTTLICCLCASSALAVTSSFYFNLSTYTTDMTLRTQKDGGSDYERYYYVTPTTIQYDKNFSVTPWRIVTESNHVQVGEEATILYKNRNVLHKIQYGISASVPAYDNYYLIGRLKATGDQYVEGRYCP